MALFDRVPDCRFVSASAHSTIGVSHDFEDDLFKVQKCPDIAGDRCYGLFAKHDIPSDTPIGEYIGAILNRKQSEELCECKRVYLFQVSDNRFIDASDPLTSSVIRYINHPDDGEQPNTTFVKRSVKGLGVRWRIYAVTVKAVKAGEQLLCLYDETPGDHDPIPTMSKGDVRSALRKRTSEVARLQDQLAESIEAHRMQQVSVVYWKRQCSGISAKVSRDERLKCYSEVTALMPESARQTCGHTATDSDDSTLSYQAINRRRSMPSANVQRNSDSSEPTS